MYYLIAVILSLFTIVQPMQRAMFFGQNSSLAQPSGPGVTFVAFNANNFSGCLSASPCNYTLGSNPTAGDTLVVENDLNSGSTTSSISSTGTGCSGTIWTSVGSATISSSSSIFVWVGVASGSGPCNLSFALSNPVNSGVQVVEASGGSTVDSFTANNSCGGSDCSFTSSSATTAASDLGIVFWASNSSSSPTATGWTFQSATGNNFDGAFTQAITSSGTAVNFPGNGFASSAQAMVLIK
jgi:hypothetical protein